MDGEATSGIPNSSCFGFAFSKRFQLDTVTLSVQGVVCEEFSRRNAKNWFEMPLLATRVGRLVGSEDFKHQLLKVRAPSGQRQRLQGPQGKSSSILS